jgi:2-deoxy-D-gluconate 3-dehydrogenase
MNSAVRSNHQQVAESLIKDQLRCSVGKKKGARDDLKGVAEFLASAASDYISGYTIAVDGGWLAR